VRGSGTAEYWGYEEGFEEARCSLLLTRNSPGDEIPEHDITVFATPLAFNAPTKRFPWDDVCKILHGGQRYNMTKKCCRKFKPLE